MYSNQILWEIGPKSLLRFTTLQKQNVYNHIIIKSIFLNRLKMENLFTLNSANNDDRYEHITTPFPEESKAASAPKSHLDRLPE
ncbi:hypothetical protein SS50377_22586 [Spironucleus salmonicida]|uniref:Uncharacterized protein n=1 Tax=Spironucleus salmonicida TaxID=348837 RepID=A0A9P8RZB8_9EUKA|nr:hypothetical protein SS50377_22586 [Spironucleus salmonicida]